MGKSLIIVESPAKIKTLKKFLGPNYIIESSVGHVRDLPAKGFGIDIENNFEPMYEILPDKKEVINKIKKAAKTVDTVYLSPDPDREGEAIAWHIANILPPGTNFKRATFNALTKDTVLEALKNPRDINQDLVDAQQARRLLDRIVGYKISPILTRRVKGARDGGLSAGRVQSIALKLVVDREKEIESFIPTEYWNLGAFLKTDKPHSDFFAHLYTVNNKRIGKKADEGKDLFLVPDEATANSLLDKLKKSDFVVGSVEKKEKRRFPVPPFITSTLQQEASRHYGFSASRTMDIAQTLYEGVEFGSEGAEGLITYMRTDSVRTAPEAVTMARNFIKGRFGSEFLPDAAVFYATKKSSQDAHEAIRPTNLYHDPEEIKKYLTLDQYKIYLLIWRRFIASQMNPAIYDTVTCDINTNQGLVLRATGSTIKFKGFLAVYEEKRDTENVEEGKDEEKEDDKLLPFLSEGQKLILVKPDANQSFTKPPPRFTEASLVKELEKCGVGRPSTYASIMNKIQSRDYTVKDKGALKPTELGRVIANMVEAHFPMVMDIGFTAEMEDALEKIEEHNRDWKELLSSFWANFIPSVEAAEKEAFVPREETDLPCPECGGKLVKIWAKGKYFYGCGNYPDCKYTVTAEALNFNKEDYDPSFNWDQPCPLCGSKMDIRHGKFGAFLGCSNYPTCKGIVNLPKKEDALPQEMPSCPAIGCDGKIVLRRGMYGKAFFSCSNYPDCDVIVNQLDDLTTKYVDHPKTPYVKKSKGRGRTKAGAKAKTTEKKAEKKTATKKAAPKKTATKKSTTAKKTTKKTSKKTEQAE